MHKWFGLSFSVFLSSSSSPPDVSWGHNVFCTWYWILLLALRQTFSFCLWCEPFPVGVDGFCYRRFQCFWWSFLECRHVTPHPILHQKVHFTLISNARRYTMKGYLFFFLLDFVFHGLFYISFLVFKKMQQRI